MKSSIIFLIKVWLTTSILSPVLFFTIRYYWIFLDHYSKTEFKRLLNYTSARLGKAILYGLAFDLILAIIFYVAIYFFNGKSKSINYIKRWLFLLGSLFYLIPLLAVWFEYPDTYKYLALRSFLIVFFSDSLLLLASLWFYKLKQWEIKREPVLE